MSRSYSSKSLVSWTLPMMLAALIFTCVGFSDETQDVAANGSSKPSEKSTPTEIADATQSADKPPTDMHTLALQSIDQIIEIVKRLGNSDNVTNWQVYRDQFPVGDEIDCTGQLAARS